MQLLEQKTHQNAKNLFISPFSIGTVLSMALAGSDQATYGQIYDTLGFTNSSLAKSDVLQSYHTLLHSLIHNPLGKENVLSVANSMAVQKNYALLESFLSDITGNFESRVFVEDFVGNAHKATKDINDWVNEQTRGKIPKLFDEDLDPSTIMVFLNAIYFKGTWKYQFEAKKTVKAIFHSASSQASEVQMMKLKGTLNYGHFSDDSKLVELPYQNDTMAMYVYLPAEQAKFSAISNSFSADHFEAKLGGLRKTSSVEVHLPRFKFEAKYQLAKTLQALGMHDIFVPGLADLRKMDGKPQKHLFLSEVIHKTYIEVNEEGSEAAAVTGGTIRSNSIPHPADPKPEFIADRPFAFFIREKATGVTLFAGVINKP